MSGQIFISYRREDTEWSAGRLGDCLSVHFGREKIFMDVDTIEPGVDFVEAIEQAVGACDVLVAVIGNRWLTSANAQGRRRLDVPEDSVRIEIGTALKRGIRVIPVLAEGALIPQSDDLPDDLKLLVRRNAIEVSHNRFRTDSERLIGAIERVLEKADAERKQREEKERPESEQRQREEQERLMAEQRQRAEQERLEAEQRQKEEQEPLAGFRLSEARAKAQEAQRQRAEQERLEAERRQRAEQNRSAKFLLVLGAATVIVVVLAGFFGQSTIWKAGVSTGGRPPGPTALSYDNEVLRKGSVTIRPGYFCDLLRGVEVPDESSGGDFKWEKEGDNVAIFYSSSTSGFYFFGYQNDKNEFESVEEKTVVTREYRKGSIMTSKGRISNLVGVEPGQTFTYQIRATYYGKLRVESVRPDLVVSFVTYKAATPNQVPTSAR